jgi:hypothetical protein
VFDPVVVLVQEPSRITDAAAEADRSRLVALIRNLTPAYRIYFVLVAHQHSLWDMAQAKCLGGLFPVNRGIILDGDRSARTLFAEETCFEGTPAVPFGYVVENGIARLIEFPVHPEEKIL